VRWIETVQWLSAHGVTRVVECGPGKVLAGLVKRITKEAEAAAVTDSADARRRTQTRLKTCSTDK
jgi:[acyl-carrier-protein] S-malonyltransferase